MNNLDKQYTALLQDILNNGHQKGDRTGTGTISVFGRQIRHKMSDGFPLLTTKKMYFKGVITELLWFLRGDTNIKYLVDNNCHIWDGDCFSNYLKNRDRFSNKDNVNEDVVINGMNGSSNRAYTKEEFINKIKTDDEFAKKWGDLGPIYGKQWRSWGTGENVTIGHNGLHTLVGEKVIDQIANLIQDLKTNPDSRRLMVNAWNVGELDSMVLPPCHYGFQVYTRELSLEERVYNPDWGLNVKTGKTFHMQPENSTIDNGINRAIFNACEFHNIPTRAISLMWNQRSVDTFLGLPFNIASYGLLLEIIAKAVNMVPDELIFNSGDTHLYSNHIEQAKEQIGRSYTYEERNQMLKESMGEEEYWKQFKDMAPFGGGLSEYYDSYKIPKRTREPFSLPKLVINDEFWNPDADFLSNLPHVEVSDFYVENYQSHPTIKAPLSN